MLTAMRCWPLSAVLSSHFEKPLKPWVAWTNLPVQLFILVVYTTVGVHYQG